MPLVKVKTKYQVTLPDAVRRRLPIGVGDLLEAKVEKGKMTLTPKSVVDRENPGAPPCGPRGQMKHAFSHKFLRQYQAPSPALKTKADKQIAFLVENLRHPSLRAKKYDEAQDVWQARVDERYRFYFKIEGDTYQILSVTPHPK